MCIFLVFDAWFNVSWIGQYFFVPGLHELKLLGTENILLKVLVYKSNQRYFRSTETHTSIAASRKTFRASRGTFTSSISSLKVIVSVPPGILTGGLHLCDHQDVTKNMDPFESPFSNSLVGLQKHFHGQ